VIFIIVGRRDGCRGPRFSHQRLFGPLLCLALGDFIEMPSEGVVQCFLRFVRDHSFTSGFKRIGNSEVKESVIVTANGDSPVVSHRIPPPKESMKCSWGIAAC